MGGLGLSSILEELYGKSGLANGVLEGVHPYISEWTSRQGVHPYINEWTPPSGCASVHRPMDFPLWDVLEALFLDFGGSFLGFSRSSGGIVNGTGRLAMQSIG